MVPTEPAPIDPFAGKGALLPEQWSALIEACPDAVLVVDAERKIRGWNQRGTELFGYSQDEAIGADFGLLVPPSRREAGELDWLEAWDEGGGTIRDFLTERRTKDGHLRLIRLSRHVFRDAAGRVTGAIAILRDVSESELELRRASDALHLARLGQLAAQIAHEMRNPLAGIHGALQILQRRLDPQGSETSVFQAIGEEVRRLDRLVQDLQRFARPTSSQVRELRLDAWLRESCSRWKTDLQPVECDLLLEADVVVSTDPAQLEEILQELFRNAREACTEALLQIRLEMSRSELGFTITVQDNGPGIPPELRTRIFEPFVTAKVQGSGLGLAVAQRHAETLGGHLRLEDAESGTCFRLELPLA